MYQVSLRESYFPAQADEVVRDTTVGGVLLAAAVEAPDATALVEVRADGSTGRSWTCCELRRDAEFLADALLSRYAPGERIAVWSPNSPEWVILEFAAALAGLMLVTVNPAYQARELAWVLEQSRSAGLFLVREFRGNPMAEIAARVRANLPHLREVINLEDEGALYDVRAAPRPRPTVRPDDAAQVQYTSGTTGFPKGALLSHRSLTNNARFSLGRMGVCKGDTLLNMMPLFHTAGCSIGVLGSIQSRCRLVLARQFDPANMLAVIERERVSGMVCVPTMLIAMLEAHARSPRDTGSLRTVLCGGAIVPPELSRRIETTFGCGFSIIYGQTETSPGLTQTRPADPANERTQTIGQPYPQTELSIRDSVTNGIVAIGSVGEICVRGGSTFAGKTIEGSRIRQERGVIILAIKREQGMRFNPAPDDRIEPGDFLIAMGEPSQLRQLEQMAGQS